VGLKIRLDRTQEIGVGRRATTDELAALDEHGFVIVPALLADEEVDLLRTEFERLGRGPAIETPRTRDTASQGHQRQ